MEDEGHNFQPSKKRAAGVQLSRDVPDDDDETPEAEEGTFKRASNEILATRRIVKVRRQQTSSTPTASNQGPSGGNPFAAISLLPPNIPVAVGCGDAVESKENENTGGKSKNSIEDESKVGSIEPQKITDGKSENSIDDESKDESIEPQKIDGKHDNAEQSETKFDESKSELNVEKSETDDVSKQLKPAEKCSGTEISGNESKNGAEADNTENETKKDGEEINEKASETVLFSSFKPLSSSQNAFSGFAGKGFSGSPFSFGTISEGGSQLGSTTGSQFGEKNNQPSFSFGNGNSSVFGSLGVNAASNIESNKFPSMQEVPVETGEEDEEAVFTADSILYEFVSGAWKERGKGELKVNVLTSGIGRARLVMRARGNYRLILNASLYPDLKLTNMDKKGVTFACINSAGEGKDTLSTIALKFKDVSAVESFRASVMEHKTQTQNALKTPENSPKTSDD